MTHSKNPISMAEATGGSGNSPLVTVLMPVYNAQAYLKEAVESILAQTWTNFELLIVDDGSTDNSPSILASYSDPRIRLLRNEENLGVVSSLNRGLDKANSRYIARMDADDISLPHRLETQVNFMEANPDVGACSSWVHTIGARTEKVWKSPVSHEDILATLFSESCLWHPAVIIRRSILEDYGFRYESEFPVTEDYRLWTRLSDVCRLANIPDVLLHYRIHSKQVSRRPKRAQFIREELLDSFLGRQASDEERLLHARLYFQKPFGDERALVGIIKWVDRLKEINRQQKSFAEPAFSHALDLEITTTKRRCFLFRYRHQSRYQPSMLWRLYTNTHGYYKSFESKVLLRLTIKTLLFWPMPHNEYPPELSVLLLAEFDSSGGTRTYVEQLLKTHQKLGIQTRMITGAPCDERMTENLYKSGGDCVRVANRPRFRLPSLLRNYVAFRRDIQCIAPDLVVASAGSLRFLYWPLVRRVPLLYVLHTYPHSIYWRSRIRFWPLHHIFKRQQRRLCTVSAQSARAIETFWSLDRNSVLVIPNSFNEKNIANSAISIDTADAPGRLAGQPDDTTDHRCSVNTDRKIVLTIGLAISYKNPLVWIDVAKQVTRDVPDVEFVWVGDGPLLNQCRSLVSGHERIRFEGECVETGKWLANATLYFQPSLKESQGLSVLDAMANALPCVVSDIGGLPESIKDQVNGYVCAPDNPKAFIDRIEKLLSDPELRKKMGKSGREIAVNNFSPDVQRQRIQECYKAMISLHQGRL